MDFHSRDRYRHVVEEIAEPNGEAQVRVALKAIESARQAAELKGTSDRAAHVGYHLIGPGRAGLETDVAHRPKAGERLRRFGFAHATAAYLGGIGVLTGLGIFAAYAYALSSGAPGLAVPAALLALIPSSELATLVIQRLVAALVPPHRLPRLDLENGVPESARTLVVIPRSSAAWEASSTFSSTWRCRLSATSIRRSTSDSERLQGRKDGGRRGR